MKRELALTEKQQDWFEYVKSLGCIFYAPLTQELGFIDLVSETYGYTPTPSSNLTISWNPTYNMYEFDNRNDYYCALWWNQLNLFPNVSSSTYEYTIQHTQIANIRIMTPYTTNYWNTTMGIGGGNNGYNRYISGGSRVMGQCLVGYIYSYAHGWGDSFSNQELNQVAVVVDNPNSSGSMKHYCMNGDIIRDKTDGSLVEERTPINNIRHTSILNSTVSLCWRANGSGTQTHMCISDVYVFDNPLPYSVINEIYLHDIL